jgi:hypothetical protein
MNCTYRSSKTASRDEGRFLAGLHQAKKRVPKSLRTYAYAIEK